MWTVAPFRRSLLMAAATCVSACSDPTAPSFATAVADVVELSVEPHGTNVTAEVTVANATARTVHFNACGTTLERDTGGGTWLPVGGVLCLAIGYANPFDGMLAIPPRSYRRVTQHLYVSQPMRNLDATNRFRLRIMVVADFPRSWWSATPAGPLATQLLPSNEFVLEFP